MLVPEASFCLPSKYSGSRNKRVLLHLICGGVQTPLFLFLGVVAQQEIVDLLSGNKSATGLNGFGPQGLSLSLSSDSHNCCCCFSGCCCKFFQSTELTAGPPIPPSTHPIWATRYLPTYSVLLPYSSNLTIHSELFKLQIDPPTLISLMNNLFPPLPPFFLPLHTSFNQRMVMDFHPYRVRLYVFSSIYKKVIKKIHPPTLGPGCSRQLHSPQNDNPKPANEKKSFYCLISLGLCEDHFVL